MSQLIADRRDVDFVLHEQLTIEKLGKEPHFSGFGRKTAGLIVSEARKLAIKEILPLQKISDQGCVFKGGEVKVPKAFHKVLKAYNQGEWLGMSDDPRWGGQGMPRSVSMAASEYFYGACNSFMLYHLLTHGAAKLVESFGTDSQKKIYLKKMIKGLWFGTMVLTEPEAGSDLSAITTSARKKGDGTYLLTGNKIFISGGDHDMAENIVHPVLARIEGAPQGIKGISLFLVPKYRIDKDGNPGEFNDVVCTGIEHKMGLHGSSTCSLAFGGNGDCLGTLLGEENRGVAIMFQMMNEARQMVGLQGFANASASYIHALNYARQRVQSRALGTPARSGPVAIICHPDVRRQLLTMKAMVCGMRSLIYFGGLCHDLIAVSKSPERAEYYHDLLEILTPVIKGYVTDKAFEVCNHGIQIFGGYGYIEDYPVAQLLRDSRVFMIYEGTNGIQSMDLLGRKLGMKGGKPFASFLEEIRKTILDARKIEITRSLAEYLDTFLLAYEGVAKEFLSKINSSQVKSAYAFSYPFLEVTGDLVMAWMLLWRAVTSSKNKGIRDKDNLFYEGQLLTARFYFRTLLPSSRGKLSALVECDSAAVDMDEGSF